MGRRGRKRQLDVESEYWKLLQSGVGTVAACKLLGIGRKTGYRWRAENGGLPPARLAESARSGRYLSLLERQRIATLRDRGLGVREIARRLSSSPSRSAGSCVAICGRTTAASTTATWRTPHPGVTRSPSPSRCGRCAPATRKSDAPR